MTAIAIVSIAALVALLRLWSLRRSRAAVLALAIPAALLPMAVAIVSGAWEYRADWIRVGETGSGGFASVTDSSRDWIETLIAGAVAAVAVLAMTVFGSRRAETASSTRSTATATATAVVIVAAVAALATLPVVLARSERAALGPLAHFVPIALPTSQADFGYPELRTMPSQDLMRQLEQDLGIAINGGLALALGLAVCLLVGGRLRSSAVLQRLTPATMAAAIAALGAGLWYGWHAHTVTRLLDATLRM